MKAEAAQKIMQNSTLTATNRSTQRPSIGAGLPDGDSLVELGASGNASRHAGNAMTASASSGGARSPVRHPRPPASDTDTASGAKTEAALASAFASPIAVAGARG